MPRKKGGDAFAAPPAGAESDLSLQEFISRIEPSGEGRMTLRIDTRDLVALSRLCRSRSPKASLQELVERCINDWFFQRGIAVRLNCSTKQGRAPDPFGDLPVLRPLPTSPWVSPSETEAHEAAARQAAAAAAAQPKRKRGRPKKITTVTSLPPPGHKLDTF